MPGRSISRYLTLLVVTALVLSGLLVELILIFADFRRQLGDLDTKMNEVLAAASPTAAQAAFQFDPVFAERSIESMMQNAFLVEAQIKSDFGEILGAASRPADASWTAGITSNMVERFQTFSTPLTIGQDPNMYGELSVTIDKDIWLAQYYERSVAQIIGGVLRSAVMSLIALTIFDSVVQRPLKRFIEALKQVEPSQPEEIGQVVGKRNMNNELGALNNQVNDVLTASRNYLIERSQAHQEIEERDARLAGIMRNLPSGSFSICGRRGGQDQSGIRAG